MRGTFTIYRSVYDALIAYPPADMKEAFRLIGEYALDGKLPDQQESVAYGLFCSVKPLLDRSVKKADAGRKGGVASANKREAKHKQTPSTDEATVKQNASKEQAEEKRKEERKEENEICDRIIGYLNQKTASKFSSKTDAYRKSIHARIKEGHTEQEFKTVIDKKVLEWKGTEWEKYLRPQTLFGTKFESYLNQRSGAGRGINNFEPSGTDWNDVASQIMDMEAYNGF